MTKTERIERIQSLLTSYWDALAAINGGKSYKIGTRELTRYDLDEIRKMIEWLENELASAELGIGTRAFVNPRRRR